MYPDALVVRHPTAVADSEERDIAVLWDDREVRCILSWLGARYRVRMVRGPEVLRQDVDMDEHVVLDQSIRWRAERALAVRR